MKKAISILAAVAAICMSEGVFFRIMHFPGAGLMILGGSIIALVAIIMVLVAQLKKGGLVCTKVFTGISALVVVVAFCFRILHWPAGTMLCAICAALLIPISAILLAVAYAKKD